MSPPILREARAGHAAMVVFAGLCLVGAVVTAVAGMVDGRLVAGAPVWNKPFKFFVSSAIYAGTIAWYLGIVASSTATGPRLLAVGRRLGTGIVVALTIELVLIVMQAWRGTASHFNRTTPFDAVVFDVMGVVIGLLALSHAALFVLLLRARAAGLPRLVAARWGMGIALVGLAVGGVMVQPSAAQRDVLGRGAGGVQGAHAVGAPDGGPGLPLLNWSTEAGDHRVAHFVGLHAMQAIPIAAVLVPTWWPAAGTLAVVRASGMAYAALTLLLFAQASQARPLLRPGPTLATALTLIVLTWLGALATVRARLDT